MPGTNQNFNRVVNNLEYPALHPQLAPCSTSHAIPPAHARRTQNPRRRLGAFPRAKFVSTASSSATVAIVTATGRVGVAVKELATLPPDADDFCLFPMSPYQPFAESLPTPRNLSPSSVSFSCPDLATNSHLNPETKGGNTDPFSLSRSTRLDSGTFETASLSTIQDYETDSLYTGSSRDSPSSSPQDPEVDSDANFIWRRPSSTLDDDDKTMHTGSPPSRTDSCHLPQFEQWETSPLFSTPSEGLADREKSSDCFTTDEHDTSLPDIPSSTEHESSSASETRGSPWLLTPSPSTTFHSTSPGVPDSSTPTSANQTIPPAQRRWSFSQALNISTVEGGLKGVILFAVKSVLYVAAWVVITIYVFLASYILTCIDQFIRHIPQMLQTVADGIVTAKHAVDRVITVAGSVATRVSSIYGLYLDPLVSRVFDRYIPHAMDTLQQMRDSNHTSAGNGRQGSRLFSLGNWYPTSLRTPPTSHPTETAEEAADEQRPGLHYINRRRSNQAFKPFRTQLNRSEDADSQSISSQSSNHTLMAEHGSAPSGNENLELENSAETEAKSEAKLECPGSFASEFGSLGDSTRWDCGDDLWYDDDEKGWGQSGQKNKTPSDDSPNVKLSPNPRQTRRRRTPSFAMGKESGAFGTEFAAPDPIPERQLGTEGSFARSKLNSAVQALRRRIGDRIGTLARLSWFIVGPFAAETTRSRS
ncbi:hypothetical protein DFJ73DRAFT_760449 [Zopfochytrium polystomum]|nr:hypothetical protein DFJ73DRAFT_760449 [Zopfochytrium polystomum]